MDRSGEYIHARSRSARSDGHVVVHFEIDSGVGIGRFDGCGPAKSPEEAGHPQNKLRINGALRIKLGSYCEFECSVISRVFQNSDNRLGREAITDRISGVSSVLPSLFSGRCS